MEMKRSYLVQRLKAPYPTTNGKLGKLGKSISFGGGLKNGGLSDEAMKLIDKIWSFDYMGASEFEFGAVPKALAQIADNQKTLICNSVVLHYEYHPFCWDDEPSKDYKGNSRVYYICHKEQQKEVKTRLSRWALDNHNPLYSTKEVVSLNKSMAGCKSKHETLVTGWIELDNGFMFFTDEIMWRNTCQLFGIKTPSKKKVSKQK